MIFLFLISSSGLASNLERVYLASFPRSGNHWVRFLIEETTHIATSSSYKDPDFPHLNAPSPWRSYTTDHGYMRNCRYPFEWEFAVVKTHYPYRPKPAIVSAQKTICLIRNPFDTFCSFYTYRQKRNDWQRIPLNTLRTYIQKWRQFYTFWEQQDGVLFIRYEDLCEAPYFNLSQIIAITGYPATQEDLERAINHYPPQKGTFLKHLDHYEQKDIELIKESLHDLLVKYGYLSLSFD